MDARIVYVLTVTVNKAGMPVLALSIQQAKSQEGPGIMITVMNM